MTIMLVLRFSKIFTYIIKCSKNFFLSLLLPKEENTKEQNVVNVLQRDIRDTFTQRDIHDAFTQRVCGEDEENL